MIIVDSRNLNFREINEQIKLAAQKSKYINLINVNGQRYIGTGLSSSVNITIEGLPGNDLAAFLNGPRITVNGNGQDAIANTMNAGEVIIHGMAGDTAGYAMRGGSVYISGNAGYRVGIHMKEYKSSIPAIIIGNKAGDFLGEYMAGGIVAVLGLNLGKGDSIVGNYCGTGMHGGVIYVRGHVGNHQLGAEVVRKEMKENDYKKLEPLLRKFCSYFKNDYKDIVKGPFTKLVSVNKRPYGSLYAY
ncbi:MAG: Glutamate synthase, alpha subunit domain protein [Firmicutes bacterium]|nr:Glutamate synthase, alpha subunit domain protein [Bacillota bacterium]MDI6705856.1 hypothetical protein [Bacillota bacterium]